MKTLDPKDWTDWWNKGGITSFASGFDNNYDGEMLEFWSQHLDKQAAITLDLCCGNGALSWIAYDTIIAKQTENTDDKRIQGIDVADIDPFKLLNKAPNDYQGLSFLGNTALEQLPFEDNYADQAISQYGLEYSDLSKTIPEISRVLKSKASIALIMHDSNSIILQDSIKTFEKYTFFLEEAKLFDCFKKLHKIHSSNTPASLVTDPRRKKLLKKMNSIIHEGLEMHEKKTGEADPSKALVNNFLFEINQLFTNPQVNEAVRKVKLAEYKAVVETTIKRSGDLISAALSTEEFEQLEESLQLEGFILTHNAPLLYKGRNYGRAIVASRDK